MKVQPFLSSHIKNSAKTKKITQSVLLCLISSIVWQILCAIMKPTNCVLCQSPLWSASKAFLNITHRLNNCSPRLYFFIYFFLLKPIPPLLTSRHFALAYWGYTNITPWSELSQWWQYCWSRPALKEFISSLSRFAEHLTNPSSSWCRNDFLDFSLAVVWLHIIRAGNKHTHRSVKNVGSWFQNRYLWPSWSSQKAYLCKSVSDPTHFRPPWPKSENVLLFDGSHISILSSSPWVMFTNDDRLGSIETSVCLDVSLLVPTRILRFLPPASLPLLNKSMAQLPQSSTFSLSLQTWRFLLPWKRELWWKLVASIVLASEAEGWPVRRNWSIWLPELLTIQQQPEPAGRSQAQSSDLHKPASPGCLDKKYLFYQPHISIWVLPRTRRIFQSNLHLVLFPSHLILPRTSHTDGKNKQLRKT